MNFQKNIKLLWDKIIEIVGHQCQIPQCVMPHTQYLLTIKKYPFKPIVGISKLINHNWSAKGLLLPRRMEGAAGLKVELRYFGTIWWLDLMGLGSDNSKAD